ncbi:MAG TPA: 16S rRNA (guanine(527)-N(7))-methyltransferase RsmG [Candidatus Aphodousia faecavium]|uniref:Ribosomal RNA small subunit methyltransferase G n=1 Tax=Parasutterella secunda TaxID=626947 RepID=A0ABS2GPE9_9BURK|nr:16S rRNA (guanine(527)-N(7))-methyltransferase RsmG [Parasutterella secunda]MBM6927718.1 16S rRNA (guanine(527)-N(7))-methyltransferase RsmG [Parasutterella secunda]HIT96629.1 16S rRNA (guanine(527)-N(7))-methyltransferase RsmG [Candidatus Aphodousia faecavium]
MQGFLNKVRLLEGIKCLDIVLSNEQIQMIDAYSALLYKWNKTYNLTSITNNDDVLTHHILDSLAAVPIFKRYVFEGAKVLDVGSGGGLPAIPLAIACPDVSVSLVETVGKKTAFLTQVALSLKLKNVKVFNSRVENLKNLSFDVISSRAFSSLENFINLSSHLIKPEGCWVALKGQVPVDEINSIRDSFRTEIVQISVPFLNEDRNIVVIFNQ